MSADRHRRAAEVFLAVADAAPDERASLLERLCGDDADLRREVAELLRHDAAPARLDRPVRVEDVRAALATAPDVSTRRRIGGYEVLGVLGQGRLGIVFRARHAGTGRIVALKALSSVQATPDLLQRFESLAASAARLIHPGIAQIHEAGLAAGQEGPLPFLAMELVDGRALTGYARQERLTIPARLRLLLRVCDAVAHAHQQGVIHRDLKPANILVASDPKTPGARGTVIGMPTILDFRVAGAVDPALTGTPSYMSPEQLAGDPRDVDVRTDIYALGVIAFELLSGRLPRGLHSLPLAEAARRVREIQPPRLGTLVPSCRGDLEAIVAKAIERDRTRRYSSVPDLAADIERFLNHHPISARPPSATYRFRKFTRRHRVAVTAGAATLAALIIGILGTT